MNALEIARGGLTALGTPGGLMLAATVMVAAWAWRGEASRRAAWQAAAGFVVGFAAMAVSRHPVLAPMPRPFLGLLAGEGWAPAGLLPALLWLGLGLLGERPASRHPAFFGLVVGLGVAAVWVAEQGPVLALLDFRSRGWWLYVLSLGASLAVWGLLARAVLRKPGWLGAGASWMLVALGVGLLVGAYQRVAVELVLRWPLSGGG